MIRIKSKKQTAVEDREVEPEEGTETGEMAGAEECA